MLYFKDFLKLHYLHKICSFAPIGIPPPTCQYILGAKDGEVVSRRIPAFLCVLPSLVKLKPRFFVAIRGAANQNPEWNEQTLKKSI